MCTYNLCIQLYLKLHFQVDPHSPPKKWVFKLQWRVLSRPFGNGMHPHDSMIIISSPMRCLPNVWLLNITKVNLGCSMHFLSQSFLNWFSPDISYIPIPVYPEKLVAWHQFWQLNPSQNTRLRRKSFYQPCRRVRSSRHGPVSCWIPSWKRVNSLQYSLQ